MIIRTLSCVETFLKEGIRSFKEDFLFVRVQGLRLVMFAVLPFGTGQLQPRYPGVILHPGMIINFPAFDTVPLNAAPPERRFPCVQLELHGYEPSPKKKYADDAPIERCNLIRMKNHYSPR